MLNFESLMARHGEPGVQAIIEKIERNDGEPVRCEVPLEERWKDLMRRAASFQQMAV